MSNNRGEITLLPYTEYYFVPDYSRTEFTMQIMEELNGADDSLMIYKSTNTDSLFITYNGKRRLILIEN